MKSIVEFVQNQFFNSQSFMSELNEATSKYFDNPITCVDESDVDEEIDFTNVRVFCFLNDSKQDYFKFTLDDLVNPCVDIKLNEMTWTAGFQHTHVSGMDVDEQIETQLENIFKDISTKKIGVHHNNYHLD